MGAGPSCSHTVGCSRMASGYRIPKNAAKMPAVSCCFLSSHELPKCFNKTDKLTRAALHNLANSVMFSSFAFIRRK